MKIDPRHLAQLSVIIEEGSFQAAADKLSLSQPALSRNMRTLEERIGVPLFRRDGRRSVPNDLGHKLAGNGLAIRAAQRQATSVASMAAAGVVGHLRLGTPPIVAGRFLSAPLSTFIHDNPGCTIEVRTGLIHELRSMLERGQVDVMFGPKSLTDPIERIEFTPLIDDRVGIMCRTGHALARKERVFASDLIDQAWLAHSRGSLLRQQTEAAMIASGINHMHIVCETDSIRSALEIVAATDLITTMPKGTTAPYLEDRLKFVEFDNIRFHRPLGAIMRRNSSNPIAGKFLTCLINSLDAN